MRVALVCNLKKHVVMTFGSPPDALAEYDSDDTAQALLAALRGGGHDVILLEGDETLVDTVRQAAPDVCFNIAEGLGGDAREAQVPALLEMLRIPYTGSRVLSQAISLDKAVTKRLWRDACLPTAPFQVFRRDDEGLDPLLVYPLFVKPLGEGTGKGINPGSVVYGEAELRRQLGWVIASYRQPALVEEYLPGREFTVGMIGNGGGMARRRRPDIYDERGYHVFPVLEIDAFVGAGEGVYNAASKSYNPGEAGAPLYLCPADIPGELESTLKRIAIEAFEVIGAHDVARVDFRVGEDGRPYLLEINTLPGLNPVVSDLCIMAQVEGFPYRELINEILELAMDRYERDWQPALVDTGARPVTSPLFQPLRDRSVIPVRDGL